ncbi:MAG: hypothetical protein R3F42_07310 [Pseudomonadota bacterium]
MLTFRRILAVLLLSGLAGCAQLRPVADAVSGGDHANDDLPDGTGWWYARFSVAEPDISSPRWHIDTLLAGEVVAPVFEQYHADIMIWRVHRRAAHDAAGHVFSFIFYSTAAGARRIYTALDGNAVLQQLVQDGTLTKVQFDDPVRLLRPHIEDTSDAGWPPVVQQTWPALAMGASRMWLDLVGVLADRHADEADLEQRYLDVEQEISDLWATQGQHAVLHHLSALFGYQPLLIRY